MSTIPEHEKVNNIDKTQTADKATMVGIRFANPWGQHPRI